MNIVIFANIIHTNTLTGGDKIFVECAKRWLSRHSVTIVTNQIGHEYCRKNGIPSDNLVVWNASWSDAFGVYVAMTVKAVVCLFRSIFFEKKGVDVVFASSLFLPDLIPAVMLKIRNPAANLVTAAYLFTTKRWGGDYSGGRIKGLLFYINEIIFFFFSKKYQGAVLTASEFDRQRLVQLEKADKERILAVRGGVDNAFFAAVPPQLMQYDAVFVGRFHPQKCLFELIEIWSKIIERDPKLTLVLVGGGQLDDELRQLVKDKNLQKNVLFVGVQDGVSKVKILKSSKIFISASKYDSGNIALDEALACGVPGVVYDLPRLNYPSG
ncbi:glycosyltransferase, partial [Patescibacteria group bacterium]